MWPVAIVIMACMPVIAPQMTSGPSDFGRSRSSFVRAMLGLVRFESDSFQLGSHLNSSPYQKIEAMKAALKRTLTLNFQSALGTRK